MAKLQLLIQTALRQSIIALFDDYCCINSTDVILDHRSDNTYVYDLGQLLQSSTVDLSMIEEVHLVHGPGFFTGVRSGVIITKALCQLLSLDCYLLSSFDYLSACISDKPAHYGIMISGSQREGFFQEFSPEGTSIAKMMPYSIASKLCGSFTIYTDQEKNASQWGFGLLNPMPVLIKGNKKLRNHGDIFPNYVRSVDDLFRS